MSKDYSGYSADDVTRRLGDFYGQQLDILTDPHKGTLRTLFGIVAGIIRSDVKNLSDAVLEKNGIEKIEGNVCYNYLPEVVAVVRARGSDAADKIKKYDDFTRACDRIVKATDGYQNMNQFAKVRLRVKIGKQYPA